MAFTSYPFDSLNTGTVAEPIYDRAITAQDERNFNKLRYTNGVFIERELDDDLQVVPTSSGMSVKILKGGCHIEGALGYNDSEITLTLDTASSTLNRVDRIVLRFDNSTNVRSILPYVKTGTNATNPVGADLRQDSDYYEICLAEIYISKGLTNITASNISDKRMDNNLCGRVLPAVPYITQLGQLYSNYQELIESAMDETLAGNLQKNIDALETRVENIEPSITDAEIDGMF